MGLHLSGIAHIHDIRKGRHKTVAHDHAQIGGGKLLPGLDHVLPVLDHADDTRVGGRAAHAVRLQLFDQRRLGKTRRGLGKMLLG